MVRVCKKKYDINETGKIEQARLNDAKDYWALLKGKPPAKCTNNISSTEFYNYFLRISNPVDCDTVESSYNVNRYTAISVITRSAHGPCFFQVKFDLVTKSACIC